MNTKQKGDRTTGAVFSALMRSGKTVLMPFGENQRYDLVIEDAGKFLRIQCKTGRLSKDGDVVKFNTCSSHYHQGGKSQSYRGQVEFFGVYCEEFHGKVWLVPVDEIAKYKGYLRVSATKNGRTKRITLASTFEI